MKIALWVVIFKGNKIFKKISNKVAIYKKKAIEKLAQIHNINVLIIIMGYLYIYMQNFAIITFAVLKASQPKK